MPLHTGSQFMHSMTHSLQKPGAKQQVFGGIARQRHLGEQHEVCLCVACLGNQPPCFAQVSPDIANQEIVLRQCDGDHGGELGHSLQALQTFKDRTAQVCR